MSSLLNRRQFSGVLAAGVIFGAVKSKVGPDRGTNVLYGGKNPPPVSVVRAFIDLAGGESARFVIIPTAADGEDHGPDWLAKQFLFQAGVRSLQVLHTRNKAVADSKEFVAPLNKTQGVWILGGLAKRLEDTYHNTQTQLALQEVLDRGGVIGGSSGGAMIQGSHVMGGPEGETSYNAATAMLRFTGFGCLRNVAIMPHLHQRAGHLTALIPFVQKQPEVLGIGIDESTAVIVHGDTAEVIGEGQVAIYDQLRPLDSEKPYFLLRAGEKLDLATRSRI